MPHILIIDDEEHVLAAMVEFFEALGYAVNFALDVPAAQGLLDGQDYEIVITDLRLSCRDTFEVLDLIERLRIRHPQTPCIVLSAYGYPENEERARQRGATVFMQKPASLLKIAAVVATLVTRPRDAGAVE